MAAPGSTQAAINKVCSPMTHLEENLDDTRDVREQRRKRLQTEQNIKSSFLIGSIDDINQKISKLDHKLQTYTDLVIESRASDQDDLGINLQRPRSDRGREIYQRRVRETKEVNQFAGMYSIKSTFLSKPSERVKNISKISLHPSKAQPKKESGKPRFVELHQYPGFDPTDLTSLPHETTAIEILAKVAAAQPKFRHKSKYKPEFERIFYSEMSQAVLQDTFWWLFLSRWQPNSHDQQQLFNRVAHNYVKLHMYAKHPQYRENFFRDYPSFLSQAVYAGFCEVFPDSYRQFDEQFKDDLVSLVYQWTVGLKPTPRIWIAWDYEKLEPASLKQAEELTVQSRTSRRSRTLSVELDLPSSQVGNQVVKSTGFTPFVDTAATKRQSTTKTHSTPSVDTANSKRQSTTKTLSTHLAHTVSDLPTTKQFAKAHAKVRRNNTGDKEVAIKMSAEAEMYLPQEVPENELKVKENKDNLATIQETAEEEKEGNDSQRVPLSRKDEVAEAISSPHTDTSQALDKHKKTSPTSIYKMRKLTRASQPVGRGPEFVRGLFDIHGQSPLVAHFLRMKHLQPDAGMRVRVQRTEVECLPPLDAPTYKDLIDESLQNVRNRGKNYQSLTDENQKAVAEYNRKKRVTLKEFDRREASLLSKPTEVKRLYDLIMLEKKKDEDSVSAGAAAALQAAMEAQD